MENSKLFLTKSVFIPDLSSSPLSFLFLLLLSLCLRPDSWRDRAGAMKSIIPLHHATRPVWSMIALIITSTQPPLAHCWRGTAWCHRSRLPRPIKNPLPNLFTHKTPQAQPCFVYVRWPSKTLFNAIFISLSCLMLSSVYFKKALWSLCWCIMPTDSHFKIYNWYFS